MIITIWAISLNQLHTHSHTARHHLIHLPFIVINLSNHHLNPNHITQHNHFTLDARWIILYATLFIFRLSSDLIASHRSGNACSIVESKSWSGALSGIYSCLFLVTNQRKWYQSRLEILVPSMVMSGYNWKTKSKTTSRHKPKSLTMNTVWLSSVAVMDKVGANKI